MNEIIGPTSPQVAGRQGGGQGGARGGSRAGGQGGGPGGGLGGLLGGIARGTNKNRKKKGTPVVYAMLKGDCLLKITPLFYDRFAQTLLFNLRKCMF